MTKTSRTNLSGLAAKVRELDPLRVWMAVWSVLAVVVVVTKWHGEPHHVTGIYRAASQRWFAGETLFEGTGNGFVYLPQAAVLYAPFAYTPGNLGDALWRVANLSVFAWGVWRLVALVRPAAGGDVWLVVGAVTALLSKSAAGYGQMTLMMAGLMLLGMAELVEGRYWRSAACLVLSLLFKPLSLPLLLLVGALYRPMRRPLAAMLAAGMVLPLVAQHPLYAAGQYAELIDLGQDLGKYTATRQWAEAFGALGVFGLDVPASAQTPLRVLGALLTLGVAAAAVRQRPASEAACLVFSLASCYVLLLSPRTENNTYALVAPIMALYLALAISDGRRKSAALFGGLVALLLLNASLSPILTPQSSCWIKPLACAVLAVYVVAHSLFPAPRGVPLVPPQRFAPAALPPTR